MGCLVIISIGRTSRCTRGKLTNEFRVLVDGLQISLSTEVAQYFEVVVGSGSIWLSIVQRSELREDDVRVATVLVQITSQWGAVRLVVSVGA
jgi:hypothetical protein